MKMQCYPRMLDGASFKKIGLILYFVALALFWVSLTAQASQLRAVNLSIAVVTPILTNIVAVSLISFFYYKESLSVYQFAGIILSLIAIILFSK